MLDNHTYNILLQLTEESKSLKRIDEHYTSDHSGCEQCEQFWSKLRTDKETHIAELKELAKSHL